MPKCTVCAADMKPLFLVDFFCPNEGKSRDHAEWRAAQVIEFCQDCGREKGTAWRDGCYAWNGSKPGTLKCKQVQIDNQMAKLSQPSIWGTGWYSYPNYNGIANPPTP